LRTWTWNTSSGFDLYYNENLVASSGSYTISDKQGTVFILRKGQSVEGLSIYSEKLSSTQVSTLVSGANSIKNNGDIFSGLEEDVYFESSDEVFHYSLGDEETSYTPIVANNLLQGDGSGVWCGRSYSNIVSSTIKESIYGYAGADPIEFGDNINGWLQFNYLNSLGNRYIEFTSNQNVTVSESVPITMSFVYKLIEGTEFPFNISFYTINGHHSTAPTIEYLGDRTYKAYATYTPIAGETYCRAFDILTFVSTWSKVAFKDFSITESDHLRAYVKDSTSVSQLQFNFYNDIQMDWSSTWSLCYWKKPYGTHTTYGKTGYNIESLGCNGNSVGGGYVWFGKKSVSNDFSISNISITPFSANDYFTNWHLKCLSYNGSDTITMRVYDLHGNSYDINATLTIPTADFYVTQYGYDFSMGWDNSSAINSYYKDLLVAKRELTDIELNTILNTRMKQFPNDLYIQNQIKENSIIS